MNGAGLASWARVRETSYVARRVVSLGRRYGLTAKRAESRAIDCAETLAAYGCYPTFATPGRVVERKPAFFARLAELGAEIAIHGYDHVDFRHLSRADAERQFVRAAAAFDRVGIPFDGFRCPYLSWEDGRFEPLPDPRLGYSSNTAVWWDVVSIDDPTTVFEQLWRFYRPISADTRVATPRRVGGLVEIPASLPDDLQLVDGLGLGAEGTRRAWLEILRLSHRRGDLFAPLFHPELFATCRAAFEDVLRRAHELRPQVWITQLRDVARWWRERGEIAVEHRTDRHGTRFRVECPARATILARGLAVDVPTHPWADGYEVVAGREFHVRGRERPFLGLSRTAPVAVVGFLQEHGYLLDTSEAATECPLYLDDDVLGAVDGEVRLLELIESSGAPLLKLGRWPDGARSALCVAGDLDALSLGDYASRILH